MSDRHLIKEPSGSEKFRKEIAHTTSEIFQLFIGYSPKFETEVSVINREANSTTKNLKEVQPWNI